MDVEETEESKLASPVQCLFFLTAYAASRERETTQRSNRHVHAAAAQLFLKNRSRDCVAKDFEKKKNVKHGTTQQVVDTNSTRHPPFLLLSAVLNVPS